MRSRRRWAQQSAAGSSTAKGRGPPSSHYSWNGGRVNTRRSAIGHCADLQQETEQGWGRAARSGTGKKTQTHTKKKEPFGRKIPVPSAEVGDNNKKKKKDGEQRGGDLRKP